MAGFAICYEDGTAEILGFSAMQVLSRSFASEVSLRWQVGLTSR